MVFQCWASVEDLSKSYWEIGKVTGNISKTPSTHEPRPTTLDFKAAPYDDINFRFLFCNEVVYPTDHDFIFYGIF